MQSSKEQQGKIRKPSSVINAKKQGKTIEWERLEISSRKLEIPREYFMQRWPQKGQKMYGPNRSRRYSEEVARIHRRTVQKDLQNPDNYNGVITQLEPDILECVVKWALRSIFTNKASGGDGFPVQLLQILKDDAVKVLYLTCQYIWRTPSMATGLEKISFHSSHKERQCQKMLNLLYNCSHLTS